MWRVTAAAAAKSLESCLTLRPYGLLPARLLCPWDSPGKNTGVGCHALLQGNLPNPETEPMSSVSCIGRQVLYHQCHLGSPEISISISKFYKLDPVRGSLHRD